MTTPDEERETAGLVTSWFNSVDSDVLERDPILGFFKRTELEATLAAAAGGTFHSFWTVDKVAEFNNTVDSAKGSVPDEIQAIFSGSKNPRLRGNKIGKMMYERMKQLAQAQTGAALGASTPTAPLASAAPSTPGGGARQQPMSPKQRAATPDEPPTLRTLPSGGGFRRFVFAPDLPADCQLRVRETPSTDGETLGVVSASDEIVGIGEYGDWIHVQVDLDGTSRDAWVLSRMSDKQLLVPVDGDDDQPQSTSMTRTSSAATVPEPIAAAMEETLNSSQRLMSPQAAAAAGSPRLSASMRAADRGLASSQPLLSMTQLLNSQQAQGDFVPYALYEKLEQRVLTLEHQLDAVLRALRSV